MGPVFAGLYRMHTSCSHCHVSFEKENGYFLGAWVAAYFIGAALSVPTLIAAIWAWGLDPLAAVALASAQLIVLNPLLLRASKLTWLAVEARITRSLDR